jgi:hypothetical protein
MYVDCFMSLYYDVDYLITLYTLVRSVGIATGYMVEGLGSIHGRCKIFLSALQRPHGLCGPYNLQPNGYRGLFSLGVKRPRNEAELLPPFSTEVKNGGAIPPLPNMSGWNSAQLIKHRDNYTYTIVRLCWGTVGKEGVAYVNNACFRTSKYFCRCSPTFETDISRIYSSENFVWYINLIIL